MSGDEPLTVTVPRTEQAVILCFGNGMAGFVSDDNDSDYRTMTHRQRVVFIARLRNIADEMHDFDTQQQAGRS
jgi:hypothetical protein